jgi:HEAT repeat protein
MFDSRLILVLVGFAVGAGTPAAAADAPKRPAAQKFAEAPATAAGRTLAEWIGDLKSSREVVRLRAALTLGVFGHKAVPALVESLDDPSPGVRYWAASHLGDLREAPPEAIAKLKAGLHDANIGVRMSAAYALCCVGEVEPALDTLTASLKSKVLGNVLSAADFLGRVGSPAQAAIPALEEASDNKDYHIKGVAQGAIRRIRGEQP